ncbi:MAG: TlpA family protein disulfide reductase [Acidobacteria bacterium]|nr:TlpA family protein disulfide reductase [Acidobacteriota bacterium]
MNRARLRACLAVTAASLTLAAAEGAPQRAPAKAAAEGFAFDVPAIDGGKITQGEFRGRILVVDVWGTWCGPCRQIIPHLVAIYNKYRARGVEVVGISAEPGTDYATAVRRVQDFAREMGITYRLGMLNEEAYDAIQKVMHYDGDHFTVPTTLILDRDGSVIARYPGYFTGQEKEIAEMLDQRLRKEAKSPVP